MPFTVQKTLTFVFDHVRRIRSPPWRISPKKIFFILLAPWVNNRFVVLNLYLVRLSVLVLVNMYRGGGGGEKWVALHSLPIKPAIRESWLPSQSTQVGRKLNKFLFTEKFVWFMTFLWLIITLLVLYWKRAH